MKAIRDHVALASNVLISNIWLFVAPSGGRLLIDTGHPVERPMLRWHLWRAGIRRPGDLSGVLVTHRHSDHAGNAAWLRRRFDCPIYAHAADAPYLSGVDRAPLLTRESTRWPERLLCRIEDRFPSRTPVDDIFDEGSWRFGLRIFPTPGHTDGSVLLYHESTRTLFSGDSILAGLALLRRYAKLGLARRQFSDDVERSHRVVKETIGELPRIETLCAGHGPAITRNADERIRRLI